MLDWMLVSVSFDIPKAKWLKANVNMTGFYRVQYSESNWQALIQQLKLNHRVSEWVEVKVKEEVVLGEAMAMDMVLV